MPLATAPRYQAVISASWASLSRGCPAARVAVACLFAPDQEVGHGPCPYLAVGIEFIQALEVAQPVGAAPGVHRVAEVVIAGVAVTHNGALVAGQHAAGVDVLRGPAAGVHGGEELGAGHVHIAQVPGGAGGGLVGVQHPSVAKQRPDAVHERA